MMITSICTDHQTLKNLLVIVPIKEYNNLYG